MKNENLSSNFDKINIDDFFNTDSNNEYFSRKMTIEDTEKQSDYGFNDETNLNGKFNFNGTKKENNLYSFKLEELVELKKYLKENVVGQDHIIDSYIDFFVLNTTRTKGGPISPIVIQCGPSGSGKNLIPQLIAEKLGFGIFIIDLSTMFYAETSSLLGATSGFDGGEKSIFENIRDMSYDYNGKMIVIFDELEKGQNSKGNGAFGDLASFLQNIMNIIQVNGTIYTKNNNTELNMDNWLFILNSNLGFDRYSFENTENFRKIGFEIDNKIEKNNKKRDSFTAEDFEMILKKNYKVSVSVMNRLNLGNNILIFNEISKKTYLAHIEKKYNELIEEFKEKYGEKKYPQLEYFKKYFSNTFDHSKGFRGINNTINITIKGIIMKEIVFKDFYKRIKF